MNLWIEAMKKLCHGLLAIDDEQRGEFEDEVRELLGRVEAVEGRLEVLEAGLDDGLDS